MKQERADPFEPVFRDHWLILLPQFSVALSAMGLLFVGALLLRWAIVRWFALLPLVVWGWFGFHFLRWRWRRYVFAEERVHVVEDFVSLRDGSAQHRFSSLNLKQGLLGKLLNYGSLTVGTPPNDLHIPRLNNFSLARNLLFGTKPQLPASPVSVPQPPVIIQSPPVVIVFSPTWLPSSWPDGRLLHLDGDRAGGWTGNAFSDPNAHPYSPPDKESVAPGERWRENEGHKEETTFHLSSTAVHPRLRTGPSIFDEFVSLLRRGIKWGVTLLLDYLDALGEGVILAAQWAYRLIIPHQRKHGVAPEPLKPKRGQQIKRP